MRFRHKRQALDSPDRFPSAPPDVPLLDVRDARTHFETVFGCTPNSRAASPWRMPSSSTATIARRRIRSCSCCDHERASGVTSPH